MDDKIKKILVWSLITVLIVGVGVLYVQTVSGQRLTHHDMILGYNDDGQLEDEPTTYPYPLYRMLRFRWF
jgi:hypothetical protein